VYVGSGVGGGSLIGRMVKASSLLAEPPSSVAVGAAHAAMERVETARIMEREAVRIEAP
jgi:hypothetical protein